VDRLELRTTAARGVQSIPIRVLLVHPERGLTEVLLLDGANPTTSVPATEEEEASVRGSLDRRHRRLNSRTNRSARQLPILADIGGFAALVVDSLENRVEESPLVPSSGPAVIAFRCPLAVRD
jgi:hypothetical protein